MIKKGFHPAIWRKPDNENLDTAIREIAQTGWDGFEYAGASFDKYYDNPGELKELLKENNLEFSSYYTNVHTVEKDIGGLKKRLNLLKAVSSDVLLIDGGWLGDKSNAPEKTEYIAGNAVRTAELAKKYEIKTVWHQHYGTVFEDEKEFDKFMDITDPELVFFCPDTAQLTLSGFDVAQCVKKYAKRIKYAHFKDIDNNRRFIELGRGVVNFKKVWEILKNNEFSGWIVVDLDYTSLIPMESSQENKRVLDMIIDG